MDSVTKIDGSSLTHSMNRHECKRSIVRHIASMQAVDRDHVQALVESTWCRLDVRHLQQAYSQCVQTSRKAYSTRMFAVNDRQMTTQVPTTNDEADLYATIADFVKTFETKCEPLTCTTNARQYMLTFALVIMRLSASHKQANDLTTRLLQTVWLQLQEVGMRGHAIEQ